MQYFYKKNGSSFLKVNNFFILMIISVLSFSACTQKDNENSKCATVLCDPPTLTLQIKIEDKASNDIFYNNSGARRSDLSIKSTRLNKDVEFASQTSLTANSSILLTTAISDEFEIAIGNLPPDTLKVETKYMEEGCCGQLLLKKLTLNHKEIMAENNSITIVK